MLNTIMDPTVSTLNSQEIITGLRCLKISRNLLELASIAFKLPTTMLLEDKELYEDMDLETIMQWIGANQLKVDVW